MAHIKKLTFALEAVSQVLSTALLVKVPADTSWGMMHEVEPEMVTTNCSVMRSYKGSQSGKVFERSFVYLIRLNMPLMRERGKNYK